MLITQFTCFISSTKFFSSGTRGSSFLAISKTLLRCFSMSALLILKSGECITLFRTFKTWIQHPFEMLTTITKMNTKVSELCHVKLYGSTVAKIKKKVYFTSLTCSRLFFGMSLKCLQKFIKLKIPEISNSANVQCSLCPRDIYACMRNM